MKMVDSTIINAPLRAIASKEKPIGIKILSGIAIGALSCLTLGLYAVITYKYFANRKVGNLQTDIEQAVSTGNCDKVRELLSKHPLLKTKNHVFRSEFGSQSHLSLMLPIAAESGNLEMVQLLCDNGASLESWSRGRKTALERAIDNNHQEIIRYLVDKGANLSQDYLQNYLAGGLANINLNVCIYLAEKLESITSQGRAFSILGLVAGAYPDYETRSDEDKELIQLLIHLLVAKGDRPKDNDIMLNNENVSPAVRQLIHDEISAVNNN